jgi:GWxTD domain-containing protein
LPFRPQVSNAIAAAVLLTALGPRASRSADLPTLKAEHPPYFTSDVAITLDAEGRPGLSVQVTVPYSELQWLKLERGYGAGVVFSVSLEPRGKGQLYGDVWEKRIVVPVFSQTTAPGSVILEKRSFQVRPERYRVRVQIQDVNAEEESRASGALVVPDYARVPVGFADLEVGTVDSAGQFRGNPTRRFGLDVQRLAARAALFDRRPGSWPRSYQFRYRILDETGNELLSGTHLDTLQRSADAAVIRPAATDLFLGSYQFEVELNEGGSSRWRVDRSFEVEQSGPPRGKEWDRMVEALAYIADPREIQELRALTVDQQEEGWQRFWARRDPTPETVRNEAMIEFFRRVRYAEQHFQGMGPGWRSDMGRIYIKFGPPDQVESRAAGTQTPQLEIWYYNQPYRQFIFADREGFGRFVLVNQAAE